MTTHPEAADIFRRTSTRLDTNGWTQGQNLDQRTGAMCLGAAINSTAARGLSFPSVDLMEPLARWLITNRPDEVRQALLAGYLAPPPDYAVARVSRVMAGHVTDAAEWLMIVQSWNDWGSRAHLVEHGGRTKEQAQAVLLAVADSLSAQAQS